ncbi:unnamed protein product [Rhizophagus irregularis]|nr:unnamed protein product [Rhizophagus irregularis]
MGQSKNLSWPPVDQRDRNFYLVVLQNKSTTSDENSISKLVDSGNQTPVNGDITHMNELRLLGGEDQNSSKITDKVSSSIQITKENSDQATSPIVNVSTTSANSENVNDSISKEL